MGDTHSGRHSGRHTVGDTVGDTHRGRTQWETHSGRHNGRHTAGDTVGDTHSGRHSGRHTQRETQWETHTVGDLVRKRRARTRWPPRCHPGPAGPPPAPPSWCHPSSAPPRWPAPRCGTPRASSGCRRAGRRWPRAASPPAGKPVWASLSIESRRASEQAGNAVWPLTEEGVRVVRIYREHPRGIRGGIGLNLSPGFLSTGVEDTPLAGRERAGPCAWQVLTKASTKLDHTVTSAPHAPLLEAASALARAPGVVIGRGGTPA
jgi:hypothetical protein